MTTNRSAQKTNPASTLAYGQNGTFSPYSAQKKMKKPPCQWPNSQHLPKVHQNPRQKPPNFLKTRFKTEEVPPG